ncbi:MAG: cysteine hydrolase [Lachnospiraceae bacterium]|nr:cysteine hydrolase [Lachnospiraceae bacterium]
MRDILIVVDMQKDFIDGALGTPEAVAIVPTVVEKVRNFKGQVLFTRDTHLDNYMDTQEGRNLPVPHCIRGSEGWQICQELQPLAENAIVIDKVTFGSMELGPLLQDMHEEEAISSITFVGLCTDICVISNVMLAKAFLPEVPIIVDAACCAGVTPESHNNALASMRICQVQVENA